MDIEYMEELLGIPKKEQKEQKEQTEFTCSICNFVTSRKNNLMRHLLTPKHKRNSGELIISSKKQQTPKKQFCKFCNKKFRSQSGRWKHEQKCSNNTQDLQQKLEEANKKIKILEKERIETLESQNKELLKIISNQKTQNINTQNINTQNNNYINIQLYLNEKCKNAMPIMDFVKELQFKLTDINPERPASTIESLSKCITDKLEDMDETERPVHCTDAKRLVFHVKDASGWSKDVNNKKIDNAIGWANVRQQGAWIKKAKADDWVNQKNDTNYLHMNVAMGKFSDDPNKAKRKVKRAIANAVPLKLNKTIQ